MQDADGDAVIELDIGCLLAAATGGHGQAQRRSRHSGEQTLGERGAHGIAQGTMKKLGRANDGLNPLNIAFDRRGI